jgi:serine/threonine-protein kinase HSL1 (negative regulator of Swe1 kinase)
MMNTLTKPRQLSHTSGSIASGSDRGRLLKLAPPRGFTSRSSLASSTRSRNSAPYMRASVGHKRGVDFSHLRRRSGSSQRVASAPSAGAFERHSNNTEVTDDGGDFLHLGGDTPPSTRYIRSRKAQSTAAQPLISITKPARTSQLWTDDVRQLSTSLARDCDEAFNRSSVVSNTETQGINSKPSAVLTPKRTRQSAGQYAKRTSLNNRPLPPPPARSDSVKIELMQARMQAEFRKTTGGDESHEYLDRMVSHIDRLIQPSSSAYTYVNHRVSSAPVDSRQVTSSRHLPSIYEVRKEEDSPRRPTDFDNFMNQYPKHGAKASRIVSAPESRYLNGDFTGDRFTELDSNVRDTIRVVDHSSLGSPVKMPAPLKIRKKSSQGATSVAVGGGTRIGSGRGIYSTKDGQSESRQQYHAGSKLDITPDLGRIDEGYDDDQFANESNSSTIVRKKSAWFKRSSKSGDERDWRMSSGGLNAKPSKSLSTDAARTQLENLPSPPKKKGFSFGRLFKKRPSKTDMRLGGKYRQPGLSLWQTTYLYVSRRYLR